MPAKRKSTRGKSVSAPTFNHAMIYSRDVAAALRFYTDNLGFKLLENFKHEGRSVYARLRSSRGNTTIALHAVAPGDELRTGGRQKPKQMPWGWKHAYLNDPDGHEVSLYSAGAKRLRRSA